MSPSHSILRQVVRESRLVLPGAHSTSRTILFKLPSLFHFFSPPLSLPPLFFLERTNHSFGRAPCRTFISEILIAFVCVTRPNKEAVMSSSAYFSIVRPLFTASDTFGGHSAMTLRLVLAFQVCHILLFLFSK